jgi:cellulose/xylan binding protein with CBM9 domain/carbohydrate binding protein with CBM4/9 domain/glycosyl hydrolase family 39 (putative alpha-L-iduronidase)
MQKQHFLKICKVMAVLLGLCATVQAENLIKNGDFETGMRGWGVYSRRYYSQSKDFVPPRCADDFAVHGKKSLKITKQGAGAHDLVSAPIKLESGKCYTLSFYVRSNIPGKKISGAMHITGKTTGSDGLFGSFAIDRRKSWQRVTRTFTVSEAPAKRGFQNRYCVRIRAVAPADQDGSVWFDGFQIEENNAATDFNPANNISIGMAATPENRSPIYYTGEGISAKCSVYSIKDEKNMTLEFILENYYYGTRKLLRKEACEIRKNESIESVIKLPLQPRGSYKLWAELKDSKGNIKAKTEFLFGVITEEKDAEFKEDSFFGIHLPSARVVDWRKFWGTKPRYELMFTGQVEPDRQFKLARDIGAKWLRTFKLFHMAFIHPEENKFNFEAAEDYMALAEKHKLKVMPILGDQLGNSQWKRWGTCFSAIPPWARSEKKSLGGSSRGHGQQLPDLKKFKEHARKLAEHYKGRITAWEIWNEPAVKMRGNEYMPLLKAAHDGIKQADPNATVVGLCGTGDLGGDPLGWVKQSLAFSKNPRELMDVISVHTYASPADNEENSIKKLFEIVADKTSDGKPLPVWNTEVGTATIPAYHDIKPERVAYSRFMTTPPRDQANALIGKELMQMALGIQKHFYFILGFGVGHLGPGSGTFNLLEYDGAPRPALVAYDAMTEIMEGAKFKEQIDLSSNDFCGAFSKGDKNIVFCWNFGKKRKVYDIACTPEGIDVLDIMGNPIPRELSKKGFKITFSKRPFYMIMSKEKYKVLKNALEKLEFDRSYSIDFIRLINGIDGKVCVGLQISNKFNKELEFNVELTNISDGWKLDPDAISRKVQPRGKELFLFPVSKIGNSENLNLQFTVMEVDGGKIKFVSKKNIKLLVAKLAGAVNQMTAHLEKPEQVKIKTVKNAWSGKNDSSADVNANWDKRNLYLVINVKDNKLAPAKDDALYNGDCVELFFDIDIASNMDRFTAEDYQFTFAPNKKFIPMRSGGGLTFDANSVKFKTSKSKDGYKLDIEIPWSSLKNANGESFVPEKGKVIGFEIAVDDNDGKFKTRKSQIVWSGKGKAHADTRNYGTIILE